MANNPALDLHQRIGQHMINDVMQIVPDLKTSSGNYLVDARTGRKYLDCISYFASNAIGYNHPSLFDPQFEKELLAAARSKPSNSDFFTVEMGAFVEKFARYAKPDAFKYLFFIEGGGLAVENALKTAFDWKIRKNQKKGIRGEFGTKVLHFREAFHGRTGYTMSLTNTADARKTKFYPRFDWPRVSNPKIIFPSSAENILAVERAEKNSLAEINAFFDRYGDDIAAIIIETIQGEGGDNHFRPEFHQALRRIADEREALLIYDEVQTGLGLTGRMWAYEHYGMIPDIVCFGKKTQVCGIMVGARVDEVDDHVFREGSRINSTWGGGLADMVRCGRILEVISQDSLLNNAKDVGDYLLSSLQQLAAKSPALSNVRGKGLMCAFDLGDTDLRGEAIRKIMDKGALVFACGTRSIRLRPALTFSRADVDSLAQTITEALL